MQKLAIGFLFDDTLDSDAGVAQYVKTLGGWLSHQGHDVSYIVGQTRLKSWENGKVYSLAKNFPVAFNGNRLSIPLPSSSKRIDQLLKQKKFDVLHVQMPHSPFMSGRVIKKASPQTAVVGTFHILPSGRLAAIGSQALKFLYGSSLARFNEVVSVSSPAAEFARSHFGLDSIVVPNVINLKKFQVSSKIRRQSNSVVFLGRLVPRKGCQQLLEAFVLLHKWMPSVRLTVAGDGPEKSQLEKFVAKNKLTKAVNFTGYVPEDEKSKLLSGARIACFPALHGESFGIVLLEAMASGSGVVVGGNNPGYCSVLSDQPELLVEPKSTVAFARRLELLLNDHKLRTKLNEWQSEHVKTYSVSVVGPQIVDIYLDAITKLRQK